jgi:uncharacterized membrane protein YccC
MAGLDPAIFVRPARHHPLSLRGAKRRSNLAGAALAACVLFIAHGNPVALILGTITGVLVGRHIENGSHSHVYVGTQFTLAILITLVPDNYTGVAISPSLDRLTGILLGMALLEPVLIAWHLIVPSTSC